MSIDEQQQRGGAKKRVEKENLKLDRQRLSVLRLELIPPGAWVQAQARRVAVRRAPGCRTHTPHTHQHARLSLQHRGARAHAWTAEPVEQEQQQPADDASAVRSPHHSRIEPVSEFPVPVATACAARELLMRGLSVGLCALLSLLPAGACTGGDIPVSPQAAGAWVQHESWADEWERAMGHDLRRLRAAGVTDFTAPQRRPSPAPEEGEIVVPGALFATPIDAVRGAADAARLFILGGR